MLKLCSVTKVKVFFLVLVYYTFLILANFNLLEFSTALLEKGLLKMPCRNTTQVSSKLGKTYLPMAFTNYFRLLIAHLLCKPVTDRVKGKENHRKKDWLVNHKIKRWWLEKGCLTITHRVTTRHKKISLTSPSANSQYIMSSAWLSERTHEYVLFQASLHAQVKWQCLRKKNSHRKDSSKS